VPPGLAVGISITAIHEREDLYEHPREFRPERFVERRYGGHEFLPFGGGIRRCPGAGFAEMEMRLVLACLLRRFRVRATSRRPARPVRRSVTMAPEGDVPMWLEPR
jgi:cytochrome P450